jgi:hypothetical protein
MGDNWKLNQSHEFPRLLLALAHWNVNSMSATVMQSKAETAVAGTQLVINKYPFN